MIRRRRNDPMVRAPWRLRVALVLLRAVLRTLFRLQIEGLDRVPAGPFILACNHLSWIDPFLLLAELPAPPPVHFLGRKEAIYNRRWKRWVLDFMGVVIPVERGAREQLQAAVRGVLSRGGIVAIFPEGQVGANEGQLQPLRSGVAHFALQNQVPVVPVGLAGTRELWRGKAIAIRIGPAVGPTGTSRQMLTKVERALRKAMPGYDVSPTFSPRPWPWLNTLFR